ncbi:MAG: ABC transporter permease [Chloroflexota bacterium]
MSTEPRPQLGAPSVGVEAVSRTSSERRRRRAGPSLPIATAIPIALTLALWEFGSAIGVIDRVFFPAPTTIVAASWRLITEGEAVAGVAATMHRILLGFVIGGVSGVLLGLLMGRFRLMRLTFEPLIRFIYPIPKIAVLPLLLVIFGLGSPPIIALATLSCFFPTVINTYYGVIQTDELLVRMARNMGASEAQLLTKVILPGAMPAIFSGLRLGLGMAVLGTIAGEFVATSSGIGAQTWLYWQVYQINNMYGTLLIIVLLGFGLTTLMIWAQERFFPWASQSTQQE